MYDHIRFTTEWSLIDFLNEEQIKKEIIISTTKQNGDWILIYWAED